MVRPLLPLAPGSRRAPVMWGGTGSSASTGESRKRKTNTQGRATAAKRAKNTTQNQTEGIVSSAAHAASSSSNQPGPSNYQNQSRHDNSPITNGSSTGSAFTSVNNTSDPAPSNAQTGKGGGSGQAGKVRGKYNVKPRKPIKRARKSNYRSISTLRKGRVITAGVTTDVWHHILSFCPPTFLGKARLISKEFYHALTYESAWRNTRINYYGADMPGPLPGMREDQYINLLEGRGCMDCDNRKVRKCYWIFEKRWCKACLVKNTMKESAVRLMVINHTQLLNCMPYGIIDSWGNYESAGDYQPVWARRGHGQQRLYLNDLVPKTLVELEEFLKDNPSPEDLQKWYEAKQNQTQEYMSAIQKIEDWATRHYRKKLHEGKQIQRIRELYYYQQAAQLVPPISPSKLRGLAAFKRAIAIPKPATQRSWRMLLPKLEQELHERAQMQTVGEALKRKSELYKEKMKRRLNGDTPEQKLVLELADEVLEELDRTEPLVADEDLGLLALRRIRAKYYEIPLAHRPIGENGGKYRLLLADAKWAWTEKIGPKIEWMRVRVDLPSKDPVNGLEAKLFKCPGCTGIRSRKLRNFDRHFQHLREVHSNATHPNDDFKSLKMVGLPDVCTFHWADVEWPINLPMLAIHQESTGRWNPDDLSPYVRAPSSDTEVDIFEKRTASIDGPDSADVVDNIIHAAKKFQGTSLEAKYVTFIALSYAVLKYRRNVDSTVQAPSFFKLADLPVRLAKAGLHDVLKNVHCGRCYTGKRVKPRRAEKIYSASELIRHYQWHNNEHGWLADLTTMPSGQELLAALKESGRQSAREIFEQLLPLSLEDTSSEDVEGASYSEMLGGGLIEDTDMDEAEMYTEGRPLDKGKGRATEVDYPEQYYEIMDESE